MHHNQIAAKKKAVHYRAPVRSLFLLYSIALLPLLAHETWWYETVQHSVGLSQVYFMSVLRSSLSIGAPLHLRQHGQTETKTNQIWYNRRQKWCRVVCAYVVFAARLSSLKSSSFLTVVSRLCASRLRASGRRSFSTTVVVGRCVNRLAVSLASEQFWRRTILKIQGFQ